MTGTLADLLPAVASVLGVPGGTDTIALADRVGEVDRVCLVLVDGLGHELLPRLAPHAPLLASVLAGVTGTLDVLSSPCPSTTPTSLVTLGTATMPGEHGILGFTLLVPGTDRVLTHIFWRDDPSPAVWQPVPTWWGRIAAAGVDTRVVLPGAFLGSGLTIAAYGGARAIGLADGDDATGRLVDEVRAGPGLVYGYTSVLDTAAHVHGIASPEWADAAARVDAMLARLAESLPRRTALVVTADHGGLDVPSTHRVDVGREPALRAGVRAVAGEPRFRHVYCVRGAADDVHATWSEVLGPRATVLTREQAVTSGRFGPVADRNLPRLGDVVAIARDDWAIMATDREPQAVTDLVGMHGALTSAETAVPLIVV
ncbi:alkaline phosphatase family protein [Jatrophihabitans sp. YIM 134969]